MLRILSTLAADTTDPEAFLAGLALRVLQPFCTRVTSLARLERDGCLQVLATYGSAEQPLTQADRISIWAHTPLSDAVREGRITYRPWNEARRHYPYLEDLGITDMHVLTLPVVARGSTIGGLGVLLDTDPELPQTQEFWDIVAAMCAHVLRLTTDRGGNLAADAAPDELSARQLRILHLIADGKTNVQIGEIMRFGTSTIGHHTMEIFRFLGVRTRTEAVAAARARGLLADHDPGLAELASEIVE